MSVRIQTLGTVRVERDGRVLRRLPAQRLRLGLLVYMAVERTTVRDRVMGVFWPDRPPDRARHLLSQTLYELRQDLGDDWVRSAGETLEVAEHVHVDVVELERAAEEGDHAAAVGLYGGRFLAGAGPVATRELEEWVDGVQARVDRLLRAARRGAIDDALGKGDTTAALAVARAWAELDPLDDDGQHRLIELLAAVGDRAGALRQYDRYAEHVARELELEPLDETRDLAERIREGDVGPRPSMPPPVAVPPEPTLAPAAGPAPAPGRWRPGAMAGAALVALLLIAGLAGWELLSSRGDDEGRPDPRRIAVLFFDDHSGAQDLGPVTAGFTEALIHELSQVDGLEVLSRAAVEPFRERTTRLDSIAGTLRAGTLVEGSLARVGDSVRVTFQLIDGTTAAHLLSGTLVRPLSEVGSLSGELPRLVARRLRERLGAAVVLHEARSGTESEEAWRRVRQAHVALDDAESLLIEDREAGLSLLDRADSLLREARAADPAWPEPAFRRGRVELVRAGWTAEVPGQREPGALRRAMEHFDAALALDPSHAPSLEHRGILRFDLAESATDLETEEIEHLRSLAEEDLRRAAELDARRALAWWGLSRVLRRRGSFAEAKLAARRALAADAFLEVPEEGLFQLFHTSFEKEEHEEALEWCDELRSRHPGNMRRVQCELLLLASSPAMKPDPDRGWALVDTMVAFGSADYAGVYRVWAQLYVGKTLVRDGRRDSARAVLRRALGERGPAWAAYDAAHLSLMLGDLPEALAYLETYVAANPEQAASLATDWWFRDLHGDPRFTELVKGKGPTSLP